MSLALILIDIQNDYFPEGKMEVKDALPASENAKKILETCRKQVIPCIHIQHISVHEGATFFLPNTIGVNFHSNVEPIENEIIIQKNYPNSFRDTNLEKYLKTRGINKLIICGMMSQMCVDATTRAAFDKGYQCIVAHDACAARSLSFENLEIPHNHVHGSFMAALGAVYANIATTNTIISQITT